jgi:O-antigen ligase
MGTSTGESAEIGWRDLAPFIVLTACVLLAWAFPSPPLKYSLMAILAVLMIACTLRRPGMGLAILAFFVPAKELVPPDLIPVRGLNYETFVALTALFIWYRARQMSGPDAIRTRIGRVLWLYIAVLFLSCMITWFRWGGSLLDLFASAKNHAVWMVFLPVALHVLKDRRDQTLLLIVCSLSLFLNCAQAVQGGWIHLAAGTLERHRASALLILQPNLFGGALALYLPVFAVLAINPIGSKRLNLWFLIGTLTAGFALILTLSRGAWLGTAAGLLVTGLMKNRKLLFFILIFAAGYQYWVPQEAVERTMETANTESADLGARDQIADDSTQMRIEQYKSFPAMFAQHPIVGSGYRSYPRVFEDHGTLGFRKGGHSTYLLVGVEAGMIGLISLALVFFSMGRLALRGAQQCEMLLYRWLSVGLFGGIVAMAICMGSGARFEPQIIFAYFWIFLGIIERQTELIRVARENV